MSENKAYRDDVSGYLMANYHSANFTLFGHVPSKKNNWTRIIRKLPDGRKIPGIAPTGKTSKEIANLILQIPYHIRNINIEHPYMKIKFSYFDGHEDRDGKLTTILDILQKTGVIRNDNKAHFNGPLLLLPSGDASRNTEQTDVLLRYY